MKIKNFFHIILLLLIIFFLSKIPRYENTLLQLNKNTKIERDYSIFNDDDEALLILDSANLEYNLYIKELKKIDNIWVGNAYSYKEAYEKNSGFKWLEDDSEEYNPKYSREQKEIEYNKSTAYFIIDDKKEIYGLSEDEIKEMLNISSLKLENPEKYIRKNGERARLTRFSQDLFRKMLNISDYYDSDKFEKENTTTANVVNKLIFLRNIMLIYLGINLILCIISLLKKYKNIKNLEKYMEVKEKRIWLLYGLDFLTLFIYCVFIIFTGSEKLIELEKFIFYYIVLKNFLLYYYLKLSKKKFRKLVVINYLVLIFISIFIRNIRINIIFYYLLYFFSLLYLPIKQKLKRIVLVEPLYLITQILYLAIVYLWLYRLM
ncbi:hypothetical protein [Fusobacterium pseudoperiodonticum]|uniref:hypothetical protein n=1 Tax=Fusobacterium pseudoperiodonticum TaxID=2663009 RepID=UPI000C1AFE45|nr:hypothetical protein [Fusobacterium pseudoperiodonticum]PIM77330.1 hypothetical protein CTM69_11015 [Fusobacterium pseudoperiodonticum]